MPRIARSADVPYTVSQMYKLVTDIHHYPDFLSWCTHIDVLNEDESYQLARMTIQRGPLRYQLLSENRLFPEERIEVTLREGPFQSYEGIWLFKSQPQGCRVEYTMMYSCHTAWMEKMVGPIFDHMANHMVELFWMEAKRRYG